MAQAPYDELKATIEGLKGQGRPIADLDAAVAAGGWTPDAFKAYTPPPRTGPAASFDELKATVEGLKGQGKPVHELDAAVTAGGWTPEEYKAKAMSAASGTLFGASPLGGGAVEAAVRGGLDAATSGGMDEATGVIAGGLARLGGGDYAKTRDETIEHSRRLNEAFQAAYPKTTFAGGVVGSAVTAPILPGGGTTALGSVVRGGLGGAIAGGAHGFGSGEGGVLERLPGAAWAAAEGGVLGGLFGKVIHGLGFGTEPMIKRIANPDGTLTPEAQAVLKQRRIDPGSVTPEIARQTQKLLEGKSTSATDVAATLRTVIAREHGVDLAAPQASQDVAGVARLQRAQAGVLGEKAQRLAEDAGVRQQDQFAQATTEAAKNTAPGGLAGYGESGAGGMVAEGIGKKADAEWQEVGRRYAATGADQHVIPDAAAQSLLPRIVGPGGAIDRLNMRAVTPANAPQYTNALGMLRHYVTGGTDLAPIEAEIARTRREIAQAPPWAVDEGAHARLTALQGQLRDAQTVNPSLARLDDVRKTIGEMARDPSTSATDRRMVGGLLKEYDSWLDDAVAAKAGTLPSASLAALQDARKSAKDWFAKYQQDPRNPGDVAGKLVEQVRAGNLDDQALFNKLMGSPSGFDEGAMRSARKVRDIVGEQSPEWQTLKQGMFRRIVYGDANKQSIDLQPGEQAWKTMDSRISKALEGTGAELTREMLGEDAMAEMRQMREIARAAAVKAKAGNPAGSGYEVGRGAGEVADKMIKRALAEGLGAFGGSVGGLPGTALGAVAGWGVGAARKLYNENRAAAGIEKLLQPYQAPRAPLGPRGLPVVSPTALAAAGGTAFDQWRREHR